MSSVVLLPSSSSLNTSSTRSWYLAPSFTKPEAFASFDKLLQPAQQSDHRLWQAEADFGDDNFVHHYVFSTPKQSFLDSVLLDDIRITESPQVDGSDVNYTFIAVRSFFHATEHSLLSDDSIWAKDCTRVWLPRFSIVHPLSFPRVELPQKQNYNRSRRWLKYHVLCMGLCCRHLNALVCSTFHPFRCTHKTAGNRLFRCSSRESRDHSWIHDTVFSL